MDVIQDTWDLVIDAWDSLWEAAWPFVPKLAGAAVLIVLGALVAKGLAMVTERILKGFGLNKVKRNKAVSDTLKTAGLDVDYVSAAGRTVFWVVIVVFAMAAAEVLELTALREVIGALLAYLPNVLAAAIVLTVTVAGGRIVRDLVNAALGRVQLAYSGVVGTVTQWAIVVFGTLIALNQLGLNTTILTANISIIVAGFALAFGLAFGLGGRDAAADFINDVVKRMKSGK